MKHLTFLNTGINRKTVIANMSKKAEAESSPGHAQAPTQISELIKEVQQNQDLYRVDPTSATEETPPDKLSSEIASKIISDFARKCNCNVRTATIGIARLVQEGGANASKTNLKRIVNDITFDITDLRQTIQYHTKSGTVRKLAKTMRDIIAAIATVNGWPGPLYKDLMRNEPQLNIDASESVWCNEIHSDNYEPQVPARIREALQRRELRIRENTSSRQSIVRKGKKGRKNRK